MQALIEKQQLFSTFKIVRYATDVTFQMPYRPSGNIRGGKYNISKHKLYGYRLEVSVLPNGLAFSCRKHYPGSIFDLEIMQRMRRVHETFLPKKQVSEQITGIGPLSADYPRHWGLLADKGYQVAAEVLRVVHLTNKRPNKPLSTSEERKNRKLSADRIVVENFCGRASELWSMLERKLRWAEQNYDRFFRLCVALTNVHIRAHPLRRDDLDRFHRLKIAFTKLAHSGLRRGRASLSAIARNVDADRVCSSVRLSSRGRMKPVYDCALLNAVFTRAFIARC